MTLVRTAPTTVAQNTAAPISDATVRDIVTPMRQQDSDLLIERAASHGPSAFTWLREFLRLQGVASRRGRLARLFGVDPLARGAERAYAGALAELEIADAIADLGDEWIVLDGAGVGGREFSLRADSAVCADRILVGPPGVLHRHPAQPFRRPRLGGRADVRRRQRALPAHPRGRVRGGSRLRGHRFGARHPDSR